MKTQAEPKPVAVFDIDGTIFRSNLLVEIVDELIRQGAFRAKIKDDYRNLEQLWKATRNRTTYLGYTDQLVQTYIQSVTGLLVAWVIDAVGAVMTRIPEQLYVLTRNLIEEHRDSHFLVAIATKTTPCAGSSPSITSLLSAAWE